MKQIVIDMQQRMEHHRLSGNSFPIDRRLERRAGNIYLDRNYVRHTEIASVRTMVLPNLHLWVIFFEGVGRPHPQRCYMHMADIRDEGDRVVIDDLYLDVVVMTTGRWHLLDVDEFRAAVSAGELDPRQVQVALEGLENACRLVDKAGLEIESYLTQLLNVEGA